MRKEKALKNILSSFLSYLFLLIAGILLRKTLLVNFDIELVGYEGLLTDLFSYISIVNLGTESILTYRLYKSFATNDKHRINTLINIYKKLSEIIAFATAIVCSIIFLVLPIIFDGKIQHWNYFKVMFILLAITNICDHLFGYWRIILTASQNEYKAITIETILSFSGIIAKIAILLTTKSFIIYLILSNAITVIGYLLIRNITKKQFSFYEKQTISYSDVKNEGIIKEYKELFVINVSNTITWSTTNIFITLFFDAKTTSLFLNYSLIASACWGIITKIIYPMRSSIADLIYKEDKNISFSFYELMDLSCFFIASIVLCGYVGVYQQAICIIFGEEFLLTIGFVFCYAIQNYFGIKSESITSFRNAFGDYDIEQKYAVPCIIAGLFFPIVFAKLFGLGGIFIGMVAPIIIKWQCGNKIVIKKHFSKSILTKWKKEIFYFVIAMLESVIVYFVCNSLSYSVLNMIICIIISVLIPLTINILLFRKNDSFEGIVNTFLSLIKR